MSAVVALLTDFGLRDAYAGVMKGVILSASPSCRIEDVSHGVPRQDVRMGAFTLMSSYSYYPDGTIFVCVVDPGVGSKRPIVWARTKRHQFLAPDNGLLSWTAKRERFLEIRHVTNDKLFLKSVSRTFHGRDIFAPVAAALTRGVPSSSLGRKAAGIKTIPFPAPRSAKGGRQGEVLAVDGFGNAVTNLGEADARGKRSLWFGSRKIGPVRESYSSVGIGRPLAVVGSSGFIELSLREGNFAEDYGVEAGEAVHVR